MLNLLINALVAFPSVLAGNWISLLLPFVIYLIKEGAALKNGWAVMRADFWRDTRILGAVYLLLFAWAVVRTIYQDHVYLVEYTRQSKEDSARDERNSKSREEELKARNTTLQLECARSGAIGETLQAQNRDQQNSINACLAQAIRLVSVAPFSLKAETIRLPLKDGNGKNVDAAIVVLSTNRTISAFATLTCSQNFDVIGWGSTSPSHLAMWDGTPRKGKDSFPLSRVSPPWNPSERFAYLVRYDAMPGSDFTCSVKENDGSG